MGKKQKKSQVKAVVSGEEESGSHHAKMLEQLGLKFDSREGQEILEELKNKQRSKHAPKEEVADNVDLD
jgi:mannitol/fructose-specific phosphotransferase system IIA component (Ntr-type)